MLDILSDDPTRVSLPSAAVFQLFGRNSTDALQLFSNEMNGKSFSLLLLSSPYRTSPLPPPPQVTVVFCPPSFCRDSHLALTSPSLLTLMKKETASDRLAANCRSKTFRHCQPTTLLHIHYHHHSHAYYHQSTNFNHYCVAKRQYFRRDTPRPSIHTITSIRRHSLFHNCIGTEPSIGK